MTRHATQRIHHRAFPLRRGLLCIAAFCAACEAPDARRQRLQSLSPVERSDAIVDTASARDYEAVAALVERLDDDDRAVRLYAILALRELCGEDFGYRYYAPPAERASAIEAWRTALREGRFGRPPNPDPPKASASP